MTPLIGSGSAGASEPLVAREDLRELDQLNQGANGTIYRLPRFRLDDEPSDLVYKEYRPETCVVSLPGLLNIVRARTQLKPQPRTAVDEMTVWPLRVVVDRAGAPTGVLMRLIPDDFFDTIHLPSGKRERIPREVQHLIYDPTAARRRNVMVPADSDLATRLRICERLAYVLAVLHGAKLVFGDLSARNVLYSVQPRASVLLVDCDAARIEGNAAVNKQQDSPDWDAPETTAARRAGGATLQSQTTDRYKLALFILRSLTPGRGSSINRDPRLARTLLDDEGGRLMTQALDGPPEERPRAVEWFYYLQTRLGDRTMPLPPPARPPRTSTLPAGGQHGGWQRKPDGSWAPA